MRHGGGGGLRCGGVDGAGQGRGTEGRGGGVHARGRPGREGVGSILIAGRAARDSLVPMDPLPPYFPWPPFLPPFLVLQKIFERSCVYWALWVF